MLSPVMPHHIPKNQDTATTAISQLIVMAQFHLKTVSEVDLSFQMNLFGKSQSEQTMAISATRPSDRTKITFNVSPEESKKQLFFDKSLHE